MISPHFINKPHTFIVILDPVHCDTSVSAFPSQQHSLDPRTPSWDPHQRVQRVEGKKAAQREAGKGWGEPAGRSPPDPAIQGDNTASLSRSGMWHTGEKYHCQVHQEIVTWLQLSSYPSLVLSFLLCKVGSMRINETTRHEKVLQPV